MAKRIITLFLVLALIVAGCAYGEKKADVKKIRKIISEMVNLYGNEGDAANTRIEALLQDLEEADPDTALRWRKIMDLWKKVSTDLEINEDILPDGLPDTDELCIVALGFHLFSDGRMRQELVERLQVVLRCAEKYPNALILCTGGPTAYDNRDVTEAGKMKTWLKKRGIEGKRIITEKRSLTTAQNAMYSYRILREKYPQVKQIAIVSSDYHIATGVLLFEAEAILEAEVAGQEDIHVVTNAAYMAPEGSLSTTFQAGALYDLTGK